MNLIHLNLMAGVFLDHPSKETPAKKSSGKMGNSPKFPVFLIVSTIITLKIYTTGGCITHEEEIAKENYPLKADVYSYEITCAEILTGHSISIY